MRLRAAVVADPPRLPTPSSHKEPDSMDTSAILDYDPVAAVRPGDAPAAVPAAPRPDLYAPIHKALRSFMGDTLLRVGRLDVYDAAEADSTLGQLDALLALCASHIEHENAFVHTAIEARRPGGAARTGDEHLDHAESIAALREEAAALRRARPQSRAALAHRLYHHLALFVAENLQHMHVEETANNAALWALYSDAELDALHGRLLASVPPAEMLQVMRWMIPAACPQERAAILGNAKAQMPPEALLGLLAAVRPHLDDAGWGKLAPALGVPMDALPASRAAG
jgi:hypothetical protein